MKRFSPLFIFMALVLSLSACAQTPPAAASSSADPEWTDAPALTETDVVNAYWNAAEVYDWFTLASLPASGDLVAADGAPYDPDADGIPYQMVDSPVFKTYGDLRIKVRETFSPELADELLAGPGYLDINGKLYTTGGARGANINLLNKTVSAEQVDENRWAVTVTFYADSYALDRSAAVIGYSQETLDYEKTDPGWRFTSFCPSDALDDTAGTVFTFSFEAPEDFLMDGQELEDCGDLQIACWLLHSDGLSEGASDLMAHRFLEDPEGWFSALSVFVGSPWESAQLVMESPARATHAWLTAEEQSRFEDILAAYQPKSDAEQALLDGLNAAWLRAAEVNR